MYISFISFKVKHEKKIMDDQNYYLDFKKIKPTAIKTVQMDPDKKNKMFPDTG